MPSRVSTSQLYSNAMASVNESSRRKNITTEKAATQKEIVRPSQDPAGWLKAHTLKDDVTVRESLARTNQMAVQAVHITENVIGQVQEYVHRARELAIAASGNDGIGEATRKNGFPEVQGIYHGLLNSVNSKYGNRSILSGSQFQSPAFASDGTYLGDDKEFKIEIAKGITIPINVTGSKVIMGQGVPNGVNLMTVMKTLVQGFETGNYEMIRSTLDGFTQATEQLTTARSELGGRQTQLQNMLDDHELATIDAKEIISNIEDVDTAKVFSDLARDEAVLTASILTSKRLLTENPGEELFR